MKEKEEARLIELKKIDKEFFDKGVKYIAELRSMSVNTEKMSRSIGLKVV